MLFGQVPFLERYKYEQCCQVVRVSNGVRGSISSAAMNCCRSVGIQVFEPFRDAGPFFDGRSEHDAAMTRYRVNHRTVFVVACENRFNRREEI